jgi:gamma-glutamylcyclotransferase (GGCT)/AIG2-like uncharacterized protein YtfP
MHVFAYGTLMFPEVWQAVVGRPGATIPGRAAGFQTFRVRDAVYPGMVTASAIDEVPGIVYLDVDSESMARLDRFEDDFYRRQSIIVACGNGESLIAEAYVVPAERCAALTQEPWSAEEFDARGDLRRFLAGFLGFDRL